MQALLIGPGERDRIDTLLRYAKENPYAPSLGDQPPGLDSNLVLRLPVGYRVVFSYTYDPRGALWRHLSVSLPDATTLPNPDAVREIAALFGFTDAATESASGAFPESWEVGLLEDEKVVVVMQRLDEDPTS